MLRKQRVEFAIDALEGARALLDQRRTDADRPGAGQMRDVCVAAGVNSAHGNDVVGAPAELPERVGLRERAAHTLDPPRREIDLEIFGQVVRAYGNGDARLLEQFRKRRGLERARPGWNLDCERRRS